MKKLYRKSTVHPSPPLISDQLSFLPAAILSLTVALSPEDKEVLAYLLSCSSSSTDTFSDNRKTTHKSTTGGGGGDHPPAFSCNCFRCYTSYWARWDMSPNRQLIHEIIDAFEDGLVAQNKREKSGRRERRKREKSGGVSGRESGELKRSPELSEEKVVNSAEEGRGGTVEEEEEEGAVRKLVSFFGERIWSVWT